MPPLIVGRKHKGTHPLAKRTSAKMAHRLCGYCGHELGHHIRRTLRRKTMFARSACPSGERFVYRLCLSLPHD